MASPVDRASHFSNKKKLKSDNMDQVNMDTFYDRKKAKQLELLLERRSKEREAKQKAWADRLLPLNEETKQCCSKKCINGCIPRPMLEFTRKVNVLEETTHPIHTTETPSLYGNTGIPEVQ